MASQLPGRIRRPPARHRLETALPPTLSLLYRFSLLLDRHPFPTRRSSDLCATARSQQYRLKETHGRVRSEKISRKRALVNRLALNPSSEEHTSQRESQEKVV